MRFLLPVVVVGLAVGFAAAQEKPPANWDGALCKPVDREAVYEFATAPAVKKVGPDRYEISFTAKGKCDVAVAIEDGSGRIARHIVYGVLGTNAPAPLKKDSLEQVLHWDGKDEFGKYVRDPEKCRVRVSLGLNPTFDKIIGGHPHDTANTRDIAALAADADGIYVLECLYTSCCSQLRQYDHDGNYIKTIYPWDPEKLGRIVIPKRTLPDARVYRDSAPSAGSPYVPVMTGYGNAMPFDAVADHTCLATAAGKIGIFTKGGGGDVRRLLRLRTDGTTGGESLEGAIFSDKTSRPPSYQGQAHMTLSPDGKWVYVTGLYRQAVEWRNGLLVAGAGETAPCRWNAVYRFAWDAKGPVIDGQDSFFGEVSQDVKTAGADRDNKHLNGPQGLTCDAAGRLYIADFGNDRIQVISPEGKYLKTIPCKQPREIAVHQKTGAIYVLCWPIPLLLNEWSAGSLTLVKFGPLDAPAERLRKEFRLVPGAPSIHAFTPLLALDSWAPESRLWIVHERGVVRIYTEKGNDLVLLRDFREEVRKAGLTPHAMQGGYMGYMAADPLRGHVYRGRNNLTRVDPEEGKTWQRLESREVSYGGAMGSVEEIVFSWDGLMHARSLRYLARFSPDKFKPVSQPPLQSDRGKGEGVIVLDASSEVPFDYGEVRQPLDRRGGENPAKLNGVLAFRWAMGGANGYNNGIGISPKGDVLVLIENFQNSAVFGKGLSFHAEERVLKELKDTDERIRPQMFPGRVWGHGNLVWRWNRQGQLLGEDLLPSLPDSSFGVRTDSDGNFFVGVGYHMNVDGKPHIGGSLAKFAPKGGRLIRDANTQVKLEDIPGRPADFLRGGRIWAQNMFWAAPGLDQLHFVDETGTGYPCECYHCKFDTDLYGRSFMPRAYAYHVQVLDTNGNRICTIGRFGNLDKPAMKPGDTDIGLGQCSYLATVSDKWLYIADDSNERIIRVKLGYHVEKTVAIGG